MSKQNDGGAVMKQECRNLTPANKLSAINRLTDRYWSNAKVDDPSGATAERR